MNLLYYINKKYKSRGVGLYYNLIGKNNIDNIYKDLNHVN